MGGSPCRTTSGKVAAAAASAAIAVLVLASWSTASAAKRSGGAASLYVLSAGGGELDHVKGKGVNRLTLSNPHGDVTAFTDRPARRAGQQKLAGFIRAWNRLGFRKDPPNAALVIADAPNSRDVLVVELSKPRLESGGKGVSFRAKLVKGGATGALSRFRKRVDRRVAHDFGEVSLFIDPGGEPVQLVFQLSDVPAGGVFLATLSNTLTAQGSFPTVVTADGPVNSLFALNAITFAADGATAVSGSAQTGAEVAAGEKRVTGTVQSLPAGSSATLQVSDGSETAPAVPLALGRFSAPLP
jgi:hypothetical protein